MEKSKIKWCLEQARGVELVEPNDNLSGAYFKEAKETLRQIEGKEGKWEVIMAYYVCYNSLYAVLIKAGIKCEIHDCTLELMRLIDGFDEGDRLFLIELKGQRIRAQYYLKAEVLKDLQEVRQFVLKCEQIAQDLKIDNLRGKLNDQ